MQQVVTIKDRPVAREITPRNGGSSFVIYEQLGYIRDEHGRQQDALFRVQTPEGYKPGAYNPEMPALERGNYDAARWSIRVELKACADKPNGS